MNVSSSFSLKEYQEIVRACSKTVDELAKVLHKYMDIINFAEYSVSKLTLGISMFS